MEKRGPRITRITLIFFIFFIICVNLSNLWTHYFHGGQSFVPGFLPEVFIQKVRSANRFLPISTHCKLCLFGGLKANRIVNI